MTTNRLILALALCVAIVVPLSPAMNVARAAKQDCCAKRHQPESTREESRNCEPGACAMQCCRIITLPTQVTPPVATHRIALPTVQFSPTVLHTLTVPDSIFHPPRA